MKPLVVEFNASSPDGLRAQARAAVNDAIRRRAKVMLVGLDGLAILDDAAISAAIVALRGLREVGGTVRLVTRSVTHRRSLESMGLDRIFDVFAGFEDAGARDDQRAVSFPAQLLAMLAAVFRKDTRAHF
jgi:anti-anti-sigma regulatory factor